MEKSNSIEIGKVLEDIKNFVSENLRPSASAMMKPKVSQVNLKRALLTALLSGSKSGREVVNSIAASSAGVWVPVDGEVFPALASYAEAGLLSTKVSDERKVYKLTEAGKKWLQENPMDEESAPSSAGSKIQSKSEFAKASLQLAQTLAAVGASSSSRTHEHATDIVREATKKLYLLLAKDN